MLGRLQRSAAGEVVLTLTPEPSSVASHPLQRHPPPVRSAPETQRVNRERPADVKTSSETAVQPPASTKMEIRIPDFLTSVFSRLVLGMVWHFQVTILLTLRGARTISQRCKSVFTQFPSGSRAAVPSCHADT